MSNCKEEYIKIIEDCIGKLIVDSESNSEFNYLKNKLGVISEDKDKKIVLDTDFVNFICECCLSSVNPSNDSEALDDFLWGLIGLNVEVVRTAYGFKAYYQLNEASKPSAAGKRYSPTYITYESDASGKVVFGYSSD